MTHSQFHQGLGGQRRTPALLGVAANASVPSSTTSRSPIPPKQMSLPRPHLGMSIPCLSSNLPPHPPPHTHLEAFLLNPSAGFCSSFQIRKK